MNICHIYRKPLIVFFLLFLTIILYGNENRVKQNYKYLNNKQKIFFCAVKYSVPFNEKNINIENKYNGKGFKAMAAIGIVTVLSGVPAIVTFILLLTSINPIFLIYSCLIILACLWSGGAIMTAFGFYGFYLFHDKKISDPFIKNNSITLRIGIIKIGRKYE